MASGAERCPVEQELHPGDTEVVCAVAITVTVALTLLAAAGLVTVTVGAAVSFITRTLTADAVV